MTVLAVANPAVRSRLEGLAQLFAIFTAASLPWSTSVTSICAGLWVVALMPLLLTEGSSFGGIMRNPAAFLPAGLVALAVIGMLWADVSWADRFKGLGPFIKLLTVPLLMWQFSEFAHGKQVLVAFLISCCLLLAVSWTDFAIPSLVLRMDQHDTGVPVKDYISQSGVFTLCCFALLHCAVTLWRGRSHLRSILSALLAGAFLANIVFVALARTSLVVVFVLFVLFGLLFVSRRSLTIFISLGVVIAAVSWASSSYLRFRVENIAAEIQNFRPNNDTSSGARLAFWTDAIMIVRSAPIVGHGTGSTRAAFSQQTGVPMNAPGAATNPHNQIFAVAIPLGAAGALILIAMWVAHIRLFLVSDFMNWIGLSVVVQNIVSSLFNSHLFDFTAGWVYVFGVGIAGGLALRRCAAGGDAPSRAAKS